MAGQGPPRWVDGSGVKFEVYPCALQQNRNAMTMIKREDFVSSIADALQFISYYHPKDYLQHLARAYER